MRNKFSGTCYRCGHRVEVGAGHFERIGNRWRVQHSDCAIKHRGEPDALRDHHNKLARMRRVDRWKLLAKGTGRQARKARAKLKQVGETTE